MKISECWEYKRSHVHWNDKGRSIKLPNGEWVYFTYNSKTHKYGISHQSKEDIMIITKAKGEAIIAFLEWISKDE